MPAEWQLEARIDVLLNLEPLDYVTPDLVVFGADVSLDTRPMPAEDIVLLAEVVGPGTRWKDRGAKPLVYAEAGIPHFWRLEGEQLTIHTYSEPSDGMYRTQRAYSGALSTVSPFPIEIDQLSFSSWSLGISPVTR